MYFNYCVFPFIVIPGTICLRIFLYLLYFYYTNYFVFVCCFTWYRSSNFSPFLYSNIIMIYFFFVFRYHCFFYRFFLNQTHFFSVFCIVVCCLVVQFPLFCRFNAFRMLLHPFFNCYFSLLLSVQFYFSFTMPGKKKVAVAVDDPIDRPQINSYVFLLLFIG